ncbi:WGR domain-containing protein, partial [Arachnia propionica]
MQRRLSLTEGSSDKFWYIDVAGTAVTVRYGRRGSAGTTKTKEYDTAEKALAEAEKQVASKVKKGYTDEEGASTQALTPVTPTEPTPKTAPAPVAEPVVVEPVVVSDAAADDLGLRVTPFELAYDLSREVVVE